MNDAKYYFYQFWGFENPSMLAQGKLTRLLYRRWLEIWKKFSFCYEERLMDICKTYKRYILKGKKQQ